MSETKMLDLQRYDTDSLHLDGPVASVLLLGGLGPLSEGTALPENEVAIAFAEQDVRCLALKSDVSSAGGKAAAAWANDTGMTVLSLAGMEGGALEETRDLLGGTVTLGAGKTEAEAFRPYVRNINGVRIGMLAVSEQQIGVFGGRADILHPMVCDRVHMLLTQCDHVIVLCHAGLAGTNLPLPEWRGWYRRLVDAGASIVAVASPGAVSGWEEYKNGLIFYGLGTLLEDCESSGCHSLGVFLTLRQNGRYEYQVRAMERENARIRFSGETTWKEELNELNALFLDSSAYLARVGDLCRSTYETWQKESCPRASLGRGLLGALLPQTGTNARREDEDHLYSLLSSESVRLAVLRAIADKKAKESGDGV